MKYSIKPVAAKRELCRSRCLCYNSNMCLIPKTEEKKEASGEGSTEKVPFSAGAAAMVNSDGCIAVMDSGVGGISVLRELLSVMPGENYLYFGDSVNAPYGEKPPEVIRALCRRNVEMLLGRGAKCIVIACNTATSAAAELLRNEYPYVPIIGMEPAVKPAAVSGGHPRVLVLATPLTIKGSRLHQLVAAHADEADFILREAPGIVRFVENGVCDAAPDKVLYAYLRDLLSDFSLKKNSKDTKNDGDTENNEDAKNDSDTENDGDTGRKVDAVVLGCTHFPFVRRSIEQVLGYPAAIYDGAHGTAMQTKRRLEACGLLKKDAASGHGTVELLNSDKSRISAEQMLLTI